MTPFPDGICQENRHNNSCFLGKWHLHGNVPSTRGMNSFCKY
jgi:hypothetical protein